VQPILITLLLTIPSLGNKARCARIGHTAKIGIGLGLLDRGLQLDKLCLRLVELLVEIWCRDQRKHITFVCLSADIAPPQNTLEHPAVEVAEAIEPRIECCVKSVEPAGVGTLPFMLLAQQEADCDGSQGSRNGVRT
jgi:hypothetical protein